jgi:nicotinamidase-related amidase
MLALDPRKIALILIDLQQGVLAMPCAPRSAGQVLATGRTLAQRFRAAGAPVILVTAGFSPDLGDTPPRNVDQPMQLPPGGLPPEWSQLADDLAKPGDILITKRQWGAFTGTDLDVQLRRRGATGFVIGGIATNFGVESTVRHGWELGYDVIVAEDACTTTASADLHDSAIRSIFPRIARIVQADGISLG